MMMSGTNIISIKKGLPSSPGSLEAAGPSVIPEAGALDVEVDGVAEPGAALGISCKAKAKMVLHEGSVQRNSQDGGGLLARICGVSN
jgi:hypothetical protein